MLPSGSTRPDQPIALTSKLPACASFWSAANSVGRSEISNPASARHGLDDLGDLLCRGAVAESEFELDPVDACLLQQRLCLGDIALAGSGELLSL